MGYFTDTLRAMRTTLRNVFRPPTTVEFPDVVRPRAERFRASFALIDDENGEPACVGCLTCEKICPSQVIKVKSSPKRESPVTGKKRAYAEDFVLDLSACIQCELCVQVCNNDAIVMVREPEQPAFNREDLVLGMEKLRANGRGKTVAWGRGTGLQEMQESKPKVEKPAKPKPAPVEAAKVETPAEPAKVEAAPAEPAKVESAPAAAPAEAAPEKSDCSAAEEAP